MRLSHIFIDRPILATVLSVFVTLIGLGALAILPVAQYPEIVPPTVQITTVYPGASADTVARTVATPLEQQINGVENMLYLSSQSTGDGKLTITVTFRIGTDLNVAQMLTQNRVQDTLPRLPEDVQRLGRTGDYFGSFAWILSQAALLEERGHSAKRSNVRTGGEEL